MTRAFRTELYGIVSVVLTTTRAKAKAITIRSACAAGFTATMVTPVRVLRHREFDGLPIEENRALSYEHARQAKIGASAAP